MFGLNRDVKLRDELIFGEYDESKYAGGIRPFKKLGLVTLKKLVAQNFISLDDAQNDCPCVRTILRFMNRYPDYTAHGYVVSVCRGDYRISLDGVEKDREADSVRELEDFVRLFRHADNFYIDSEMYCWFG